jgi:hypothetical protein
LFSFGAVWSGNVLSPVIALFRNSVYFLIRSGSVQMSIFFLFLLARLGTLSLLTLVSQNKIPLIDVLKFCISPIIINIKRRTLCKSFRKWFCFSFFNGFFLGGVTDYPIIIHTVFSTAHKSFILSKYLSTGHRYVTIDVCQHTATFDCGFVEFCRKLDDNGLL